MKAADWISALEKFLNDILGTVIPGAVLLILLSYAGISKFVDLSSLTLFQQNFLFLIASYVLGHLLDQISLSFPVSKIINFLDNDDSENRNKNIPIFKSLLQTSSDRLSPEVLATLDDRNLRSMAMTMSIEGKFLSRKFRFLQLLCTSTAVAIIIASVFELINLVNGHTLIDRLIFVGIGGLSSLLLIRRGSEFNRRSKYVCFDCVVAEHSATILKLKNPEPKKK